jgi:hypothetical protein
MVQNIGLLHVLLYNTLMLNSQDSFLCFIYHSSGLVFAVNLCLLTNILIL